jgi:quinol monooxygenase YgiN
VADVYGLIVRLRIVSGKREEMIALLKESARGMPGCVSYVVAKDLTDENALWVTEIWDSIANHDASLTLPAVTDVMPRARAIVSAFDKIAITEPVWEA